METNACSPVNANQREALYSAIETLILHSASQTHELLDFLRYLPLDRKIRISQNLRHLEKSISVLQINK